jgi:hypothetical protein
MTDLAVSYVSFGSYTFPLGTVVKSRDASTDIEETKMLGIDGSIAPAGVLRAQTITLEINIGGAGDFDPSSTPTDIIYLESMDDLNNALNDLFAELEQGYQALTLGYTPARTTQAQKQKFNPAYMDGSSRRHATVSMDFLAPDPRWLSVATQTLTANGNATNNGNMNSYPLVTYTQTGGPASEPVNLQVFLGDDISTDPYVELNLNLTLQSGDVLVINCDPRQRAQGIIYTPASTGIPVNGLYLLGTTGMVNTVGNDATFPYLIPGINAVKFAGANSIAFVWPDAYGL